MKLTENQKSRKFNKFVKATMQLDCLIDGNLMDSVIESCENYAKELDYALVYDTKTIVKSRIHQVYFGSN